MQQFDWLQYEFLENSVSRILLFAVTLILGLLFKRFVSHHLSGLIYRVVKKKDGQITIEQFRTLLHKPVALFLTLITIYLAFAQLQYPPSWHLVNDDQMGLRLIVWKLFQLSIVISVTWVFLRLADYIGMILLNRAKETADRSDDQLVSFFKEAMKVVIVIFSVFVALGTVFEINVAGLIAGLGIGGIAIALAAKDTIENLLASFMIFIDKPFIVGDLIKSGSTTGTVVKIGFRSTQLRTVERTIVIVPNRKLVDTEVENISRRGTMRALLTFNLDYRTEGGQIEKLLQSLRDQLNQHEYIEKEAMVRIERFTETGIEVSAIFYVLTDKNEKFTRIREEVLLRILTISSEQDLHLAAKASN